MRVRKRSDHPIKPVVKLQLIIMDSLVIRAASLGDPKSLIETPIDTVEPPIPN